MTALGFAQTTPQGRHDMVDAREKRIAQIHRCTDTPGGIPHGGVDHAAGLDAGRSYN